MKTHILIISIAILTVLQVSALPKPTDMLPSQSLPNLWLKV